MNVNEIYGSGSSGSGSIRLKTEDGNIGSAFTAGDIIEGKVTGADDKGIKVSFGSGSSAEEITFPADAIGSTYAGDVRNFKVLQADADKVVLRDMGSINSGFKSTLGRGLKFTTVNTGLSAMVEDFSETMGDKEKEDNDNIEKLSDRDYSELRQEGYSIEDYRAERLSKAIVRVKTGIEKNRENAEEAGRRLETERQKIRKQAAGSAAADAGSGSRNAAAVYDTGLATVIAGQLQAADLPVTDAYISDIGSAVRMAAGAADMTDSSYAYMIGNELPATASNIYRAAFGGSARRTGLDSGVWQAIKGDALQLAKSAGVGEQDAKWMLEYDLPLTVDNLQFKEELKELKSEFENSLNGDLAQLDAEAVQNSPAVMRTIEAAIDAIYRGEPAANALLIPDRSGADGSGQEKAVGYTAGDVKQLTSRLGMEEMRLKLTTENISRIRELGIDVDTAGLDRIVEGLRTLEKQAYEGLAEELGINVDAEIADAADLTQRTMDAVFEIRTAPDRLLADTFDERGSITLEGLAGRASAAKAYEASATEVRKDLGDSMQKAFASVDSLLQANDLELTEANRRAVKILGQNGMEISSGSISEMKYYDAKVTALTDSLKPAVVMGLIHKGIDPLDTTVDELKEKTDELLEEEGYSAEEKYSTFLLRMEEEGSIGEQERQAYIGIYRLLYQVQKNDGAAIGALVKSGRKLTLGNLLTEARSAASAVDESIDDGSEQTRTQYTNSITYQISSAIDYERSLAEQITDITSPDIWQQALAEYAEDAGSPAANEERREDLQELSSESLLEKLLAADSGADIYGNAERVRAVMAEGSAVREYLRSFGQDDSVNNILAARREEGAELAGNAAQLPEDERDFDEAYTAALDTAREETLETFYTGRGSDGSLRAAEASELTGALARYGLLKDMAGSRHFEFTMPEAGDAKVSLTLVRGRGNTGSVSIDLTGSSYHLTAEFGLEDDGNGPALVGTAACDSSEEMQAASAAFESFRQELEAAGTDSSGIRLLVDSSDRESYMSRLGEIKRRAAHENGQAADDNTDVVSTQDLYRVARMFLEKLL